jgi:2,3-dimethylmalate lyase
VFTALIVEQAGAVRRMAARVCIPVIADGDTGYGDLHNVQRTVEAFEVAGASGILLEDQVMPKRCGHLANKRVIPSEEMVLKIKAAVTGRGGVPKAPGMALRASYREERFRQGEGAWDC